MKTARCLKDVEPPTTLTVIRIKLCNHRHHDHYRFDMQLLSAKCVVLVRTNQGIFPNVFSKKNQTVLYKQCFCCFKSVTGWKLVRSCHFLPTIACSFQFWTFILKQILRVMSSRDLLAHVVHCNHFRQWLLNHHNNEEPHHLKHWKSHHSSDHWHLPSIDHRHVIFNS